MQDLGPYQVYIKTSIIVTTKLSRLLSSRSVVKQISLQFVSHTLTPFFHIYRSVPKDNTELSLLTEILSNLGMFLRSNKENNFGLTFQL